MVEEGVEHPHPIETMLQQLLELRPDDLQLVLSARRAPRLALSPVQPPTGEQQKWRFHWVPDVKPLPMPPPIGVAGGVCGIGTRRPRLLL